MIDLTCQGSQLLIPEKPDIERDAVAAAWVAAGGDVQRLARFWDPPPLSGDSVCIYGPDSFALVLAQILDLDLVSPPDDLLLQLPTEFLGREIRAEALEAATSCTFPVFAKPLVPKQFHARVFNTVDEFEIEIRGLAGDQLALLSSEVSITAEARAFVLERRVLDCAIYEGGADPGGVRSLLARAAWEVAALPSTSCSTRRC